MRPRFRAVYPQPTDKRSDGTCDTKMALHGVICLDAWLSPIASFSPTLDATDIMEAVT